MDLRVRSYLKDDGTEVKVVDRQARNWFFILYADNPVHVQALEKFLSDPHSLVMCHDRSMDPLTGELKKKHWHCIYMGLNNYDRTYMFSVMDHIGLPVQDSHLFKILFDLQQSKRAKRFTLDSYIVYLTHVLDESKETYSPSEYQGDLLNIGYAMKVCQRIVPELKSDNVKFILKIIDDHFKVNSYMMYEEFLDRVIQYGYFDMVYSKWNFYKSIIDQRNDQWHPF